MKTLDKVITGLVVLLLLAFLTAAVVGVLSGTGILPENWARFQFR